MLRVLTLATLFPDATRPNFGVFVERQTLGLSRCAGVEVRVVAPVGIPPWPLSRHAHYAGFADVPLREAWHGLSVERPRFAIMPGTGGRLHVPALIRRLQPVLSAMRRDFPFDVIDAEFFFPDGPAAVALGRHFGVPVSIKARGADIHLWGQGPTRAQVRRAGQAADAMLAVSAAMRADMVALGIPAERIAVHHTGVDAARFGGIGRAEARAAHGLSGPVVISLGALVARKGHDVVIDAVAMLPDATLLIVGEGPEREVLAARIVALGLSDRVRLTGAVAHAELGRLLPAADVMALASASEGLANAWVEAMACGVPIVIPDIGGAREVLTDPGYGLIADRTPAAFAEAIGMLIAQPPLPERVQQGAARFSWDTNATALHAHLARLVAGR
ncbi:MAG: glycoside hydrolase [Sphingomonas sp.]|nr:glycoside hydrolase [Sphingomonas sp.]